MQLSTNLKQFQLLGPWNDLVWRQINHLIALNVSYESSYYQWEKYNILEDLFKFHRTYKQESSILKAQNNQPNK